MMYLSLTTDGKNITINACALISIMNIFKKIDAH